RVGVVEGLQLRLFFQRRRNGLVERALYVGRLNFVLNEHRVAGCRGQALPGLRVEAAARLDSVCVLKRGDSLLIVRPALAVDLAGREAGAIEQYLSLDERGRAGGRRASFAGFAGRRRQLRRIDGLRIERWRGACLARPAGPARLSVRRTRHHQDHAGADESRSRESANGHAQLAPAPPPERANPVLGARTGGPEDVMGHCHGQLLVLRKRISAQARGDGHTLLRDVAERHVEQCPLRSPTASNRFALPRRSVWWRAARAPDVPPRRNAGRHCAKESSHLARLVPPIPSRQLYGCVEKSLSRLTNLVGAFANFSPLLFRRGVANLSPSELTPHLECKISLRGRGDEKASGDRVFCHFIDGRNVLRRRLAGDGTAAVPFGPFGPSHARRVDRHLFWSQRRLRLGIGLIKYRFWRRIDGRHDDATWPRRDRARCFGPSELKPSARWHCWRSNRFQLASRKGRLRSRA